MPGSEDQADPVETITDGLAALGLVIEEGSELDVEEEYWLWPDNLEFFDVWLGLQTQWLRMESGQRAGLNYAGVEAGMRMDGFSRKKREKYFPLIRVMEMAVLNDSSRSR